MVGRNHRSAHRKFWASVASVGLVVSATLPATSSATGQSINPYSPPLREPREGILLWGDLHLHTDLSPDAFLNGTRSVGPEEAYSFAMGRTIRADNGFEARLRRPLDFIAITDHSEYLGVFPKLIQREESLLKWPLGRQWADWLAANDRTTIALAFADAIQSSDPALRTPDETVRRVWEEVAEVADRYNRPGQFTALIGYEWTSMINGDNLHRVVIFRGDADEAKRVVPFTAQDSTDPEDLWKALERYEERGARVLAIAHNGNVSNGRMFAPTRVNGQPLNARYAEMRSRWEPV